MRFRLSERKKQRIFKNLKIYLFGTGILLIGLIVFFETQISPFERKCIRKEAKSVAVKLVNKSFEKTMEDLEYSYSDLVSINYANSGEAKSIEIDSVKVSKFKSSFMNNFQKYMDIEEIYAFSVPLGAFSEINAINSYGPDVTINFRLTGSVNCKIKSSFESAGVNQTVHHIYLVVSADIITISPGYSKEIKFSTDYEIAQTVIVGNTPSLYASVNN